MHNDGQFGSYRVYGVYYIANLTRQHAPRQFGGHKAFVHHNLNAWVNLLDPSGHYFDLSLPERRLQRMQLPIDVCQADVVVVH